MQRRTTIDVVVGDGLAIFEMAAAKDEALLLGWDALLVLCLLLEVADGVLGLGMQADRLARQRHDPELYANGWSEKWIAQAQSRGKLVEVAVTRAVGGAETWWLTLLEGRKPA